MNTQPDAIAKQQALSEVIALIYNLAEQPSLWPDLLNRMNIMTQALEDHDKMGDVSVVAETAKFHKMLLPHFERSLKIHQKIYQLEAERHATSDILDRLPIGVILTNSDAVPVAMNAHAKALLALNESLKIQDGKLAALTPADTSKLQALLSAATTTPAAPQQHIHGESLLITASTGLPCSIHISPSAHTNIHTDTNLAAVFISSSSIQQNISLEVLESIYGFTLAEAKLVHALLKGSHSLTEAAELLHVSKHTVRTQMKSILEKTDTHSQNEMLKKILRSPAALLGEKQSPVPILDLKSLEKIPNHSHASGFHLLALFDGRKLEYTEFGDPEGTPVIYFHGILHAREKFHPFSSYPEKHGLRIIAPERPGFGKTSMQAERSLRTYTQDIAQLVKHLNIDTFYVLGDGDGGPAALACANLLGDRVRKAAVVGCMPDPTFEHMENIMSFDRKLMIMAKSTPKAILNPFCRMILKALRRNNNYFRLMFNEFCKADQAVISTSEHEKLFQTSMDNLLKENVDGFIDDYFSRLYLWDFSVGATTTEVDMWHGEEDCFSNIRSAKSIAYALPHCNRHFLKGHGHYLFISHIDDILHHLTAKKK